MATVSGAPAVARGPRTGATPGVGATVPTLEAWRAAFARRVQWALLNRAMSDARRAADGVGTAPRLTQRVLTDRLNDALKPELPLIPETVRKWISGVTTPDPIAQLALAQVLEVDAGWLTHGTASAAPAPYTGPHAAPGGVRLAGDVAARTLRVERTERTERVYTESPSARSVAEGLQSVSPPR